MPQLVRAADKRLSAERAVTAERQRQHEAAFAELGPRFVAQPGMSLDDLVPINRAMQIARTEGRLAGLGELAKYATMGRGGMADVAPWLRRMSARIARRPDQQDDLIQAANEAVLREGGELNPVNAMRTAKTTMLNMVLEGGQGARSSVVRAINKAQSRIGENAGEFRLWSETNKNLTKPITLDQFRQARAGVTRRAVSLDRPGTELESLVGADNPESAAILREGFRKLTRAQQTNLAKRLRGEEVNPAILKRIQDKLKGEKAVGYKPVKPISGGSAQQGGFESIRGFRPSEVMNEEINPTQLPGLTLRGFWEDVGPSNVGVGGMPGELGRGRIAGTTRALEQGVQLPSYDTGPLAHPATRSVDRFVPGAANRVVGTQDELDALRSMLLDAALTSGKN